jgi:hypothetical protein
MSRSPVVITSSQQLTTSNDIYLIDATGNSIDVTLPCAINTGIYFKIRRIDTNYTNTVRIIPNDENEKIEGQSELFLTSDTPMSFVCIDLSWYKV